MGTDGKETKELLDLGVTEVTYSNNVISNGVVDETVCGVFDTLKESIEGADSTVNNMLMIADHPETNSVVNNTNVESWASANRNSQLWFVQKAS